MKKISVGFKKKQKKAAGAAVCIALLITLLAAPTLHADAASDDIVTVNIVHTNDIHGRSGYEEGSVFGFEKLAAYIDETDPDLVIDAGDLYHGQAFATMEEGGSIAELVNAVGYDLLTPGNHDWNYGKDRLKELGQLSGVEILAGNVTQNGEDFFGNGGIYTEEITDEDGDKVKVGVLGVFDQDIRKDTAPANTEGLDFADDAETATALAAELRNENCDIVIAISHQLDCAAFLAQTSGIDVLIAGHEHEVINTSCPDSDGKSVQVVETGAYFENIGDLTLTYNINTNELTVEEKIVTAAEAAALPSDQEVVEVVEILDKINARQEQQLTQVVGTTGRDLDGTWESLRIEETGMGRLVTAAYLAETGADVAFENAGGIRIGRVLEAGDITWGDIIDTAPYGNYIVTKEISGQDLLEILEQSIEIGRQNKISYDEWVQTGAQVSWPANSGSYLQFAGISVQYDMSKPEGERVLQAKIRTEDLDPAGMYTIATNNYVALGDDYVQLKDAAEINQYGACDEALEDFVRSGQDVVDAATGMIWLQETSEDTGDNGEGGDTGNTGDTGKADTDASKNTQQASGAEQTKTDTDKTAAVKTGDDQQVRTWLFVSVSAAALLLIIGESTGRSAVKRKGKSEKR